MRRLDVLHLAAAAAFGLTTSFAGAMPVQAAGLSAKQKDEISEFVKCQTYLLKGDLGSFNADRDCGHGPVVFDLHSLASQPDADSSSCSSGGGYGGGYGHYRPSDRSFSMGRGNGGYGGGHCYEERKHKHKHKKRGHGFPGNDN